MGIEEQAHNPLRKTFLNLRLNHTKPSDEFLLDVAIKTRNNSTGIDSLIPSFLLYGAFPRLPIRTGCDDALNNMERPLMRQADMAGFNKRVDDLRLEATHKCQAATVPTGLILGTRFWSGATSPSPGPDYSP